MHKIIYTCIDGMEPGMKFCVDLHRKYASRIGAEVVELEQANQINAYWTLFDAMRDSLSRDKEASFVWLDGDMVCNPRTAKDVFEYPDRLMVCIPPDSGHIIPYPFWYDVYRDLGFYSMLPYPVTGIVKWSRRHAEILCSKLDEVMRSDKFDEVYRKLPDQEMMMVLCDMAELGWKYFDYNLHSISFQASDMSSFIHCAGPNKLKRLIPLYKRYCK